MQLSLESMHAAKAMAETGNPNSSDRCRWADYAPELLRIGAHMNVLTNAAGLKERGFLRQDTP